ncbi:glycosyltransferase family 2 protein [Klebsiella michiganensis]|jgi:rhamnosyltransferase|uniref:glycosyltransferase family 2 protein n=1 Tax=Klebsiella michiganensis TaxID=1134687 RepID=UPI002245477D|nr:glycosyltransferase family 2 protein [Klebsiella michiganensis]MCW9669561.1 glycosyltransferase family 2 protein [Klebsiella michiganensis]MDM4163720.1 glycosyltransferase family 2 protein [Klebsiella michiganensis]
MAEVEMKIGIFAIVVTYHPDNGLRERLLAIKDQVDEVSIVDNSENIEAINDIKSLCLENGINYLGDGVNYGIAYSLNLGAKLAKSKGYQYYITFDQDSLIPDHYVTGMLSVLEKDKNIGMIGPVYKDINDGRLSRFPVKEKWFVRRKIFTNEDNIQNVMCIITSGAICRTDIFDTVGYFLDKYFIDYVDNEFCLRLLSAGYRVCVNPKIVINHALGNRKIKLGFSPTNYPFYRKYYVTRNRLNVWKRYVKKYPSFILYDFSAFLLDLFRVMFLEDNKIKKLKAMIAGGGDFMRGKYGKMEM